MDDNLFNTENLSDFDNENTEFIDMPIDDIITQKPKENKGMGKNVFILCIYTFALYLFSVYTGVNRMFLYVSGFLLLVAIIVAVILNKLKTSMDRLMFTLMFVFLQLGALIQLILMTEIETQTLEGVSFFFELNDDELKTVLTFIAQYAAAFIASIMSVLIFKTFMKRHATMKLAAVLTAISAVAYIFVIVFGKSVGGTRVDVVIGGFSFQPGEILKYFYCIIIGIILGGCDEVTSKRVRYASLITIMFLVFMVLQGEFGTLQVVALSYFMIIICYMGKRSIAKLLLFVAGLGIAGTVVYFANSLIFHVSFITTQFDKILGRFRVWLDPSYDIYGAGFQMHEAMKKIYLSGWFGQYGSRNTIYAAENDLVIVSVIYAFGMITAIAIVIAFMVMGVNQFRVVSKAKNSRLKVMAAMASAILFSQVFFNIGGATGVLPLSGITLPFISRGGSSIVGVALMMTLVFMLSADRGEGGIIDESVCRQKDI